MCFFSSDKALEKRESECQSLPSRGAWLIWICRQLNFGCSLSQITMEESCVHSSVSSWFTDWCHKSVTVKLLFLNMLELSFRYCYYFSLSLSTCIYIYVVCACLWCMCVCTHCVCKCTCPRVQVWRSEGSLGYLSSSSALRQDLLFAVVYACLFDL